MARDWDGKTYDRISGPMADMGREVLARLPLKGDETVVDAGCGSGRVTAALLERLPRGRVIAVDASAAMLDSARERLGPDAPVDYVEADLAALELDEPVDAVLSTATFHWIADQDALYRSLHGVLRPGGRLVAQCGGEGNIADIRQAVTDVVAADERFAAHLGDWYPWKFLGPQETERRLSEAGFAEGRAWLEPKTIEPGEGQGHTWLKTVNLGGHCERLPKELRDEFIAAVLDRLGGDPLALGYVRLNIEATA